MPANEFRHCEEKGSNHDVVEISMVIETSLVDG